jgi:glycosyltransferase 2 family protein
MDSAHARAELAEPLPPDEPVEPTPPPRARRRSIGRIALSLLGVALLVFLVWQVGTQDLLHRLLALGWRAPLMLWPYALISAIDGWAWAFTLPRDGPKRPSLLSLTMIRLAGESVNELTPTAYLGGEPVKAMLLVDRGITAASSTVSVVVAKTMLTVGQVVFTLLGIMLTLERFDILHNGDVLFVVLCVLGAGFVALLVRLQRRQLFTRLARLAGRFGLHGPRIARFAEVAPKIDGELRGYYSTRAADFAIGSFLNFIGWLLGTVEIKVFADLLDYPVSWRDAFIIESISQPLALGAALVPGAIGVREAGGVAIFGLLGLDESAGLAVWLLRRVREAVFSAVGLLYLMAATRGRKR